MLEQKVWIQGYFPITNCSMSNACCIVCRVKASKKNCCSIHLSRVITMLCVHQNYTPCIHCSHKALTCISLCWSLLWDSLETSFACKGELHQRNLDLKLFIQKWTHNSHIPISIYNHYPNTFSCSSAPCCLGGTTTCECSVTTHNRYAVAVSISHCTWKDEPLWACYYKQG